MKFFKEIRDVDSTIIEIVSVFGESFELVELGKNDRRKVLHDLAHFYSANYGAARCIKLPPLGLNIPPELKGYSQIDGTTILDARCLVQKLLTDDRFAREHEAIFRCAADLFDLEEYAAGNPTHDRPMVDIYVAEIGYIRDTGPFHAGKMLTQSAFFVLDPTEMNTPYSAVGDIYGLLVKKGRVVAPALAKRSALLVGPNGVKLTSIGILEMGIAFEGRKIPLDTLRGVAAFTAEADVAPYTPDYEGSLEIGIVGVHLVSWKNDGNLAIPMAGCVLRCEPNAPEETRGLFRQLISQRSIDWFLPGHHDTSYAFQTGPRIISNGKFGTSEEEMATYSINTDYVVVPGTAREAWEIEHNRPKAAIGINSKQELILGIADAQSVEGIASILIKNGASEGVLIDAGGSACAFFGSGAVFANRDTRSNPLALWDRPLPLAIAVV